MIRNEAHYSSAIERNVANAAKYPEIGKKYSGLSLSEAKHKLGIRARDEHLDTKVQILCEARV